MGKYKFKILYIVFFLLFSCIYFFPGLLLHLMVKYKFVLFIIPQRKKMTNKLSRRTFIYGSATVGVADTGASLFLYKMEFS